MLQKDITFCKKTKTQDNLPRNLPMLISYFGKTEYDHTVHSYQGKI